jgi:P-type conjugative transfer protein TrbG
MKQMKPYLLFAFAPLIAGCAMQSTPNSVPYVPASVTNPPPKPIDIGPDPIAQLPEELRSAITQHKQPVMHDGITTVYPYDAHGQPAVNCQILRVTEIVLAPGETVRPDDVGIGDSERWSIKVSASRVLVKPKEPGIATDLVVVTNQRSYHFTLRTHVPYQPQISFYYPDEIRAEEADRRDLIRQALVRASEPKPSSKPLNFDYTIKGPPVSWKPVLAFDDGDHFYLEFPQNIAGTDMPTLMSQQGKQQETVNYEVRGQYYVADRLLPSAVLTSGTGANRQAVQITTSR